MSLHLFRFIYCELHSVLFTVIAGSTKITKKKRYKSLQTLSNKIYFTFFSLENDSHITKFTFERWPWKFWKNTMTDKLFSSSKMHIPTKFLLAKKWSSRPMHKFASKFPSYRTLFTTHNNNPPSQLTKLQVFFDNKNTSNLANEMLLYGIRKL